MYEEDLGRNPSQLSAGMRCNYQLVNLCAAISYQKCILVVVLALFRVLQGSLALQWTDSADWASALVEHPPVIVWWTPRLYPHWGKNITIVKTKLGQCLSTTSKAPVSTSGDAKYGSYLAFLFYGTDFQIESLPLPRLNHHLWALLHEESPMNNYIFSHTTMIKQFNFTATFRRESHYPLTTLFLPNLSYLTERQPVSLRAKNLLRQQQKFAPVLYVQSHCDVASDRDSYVKELAKHVAIDSYGRCLQNKSLPEQLTNTEQFQSEEFLDFIANYKFHLAFENAICEDYITEKLFRALHVGSIPVYRGSPSVKHWVPADPSVILVDEFSSPKELADYINWLDSYDEQYEEYLKFKQPNGISNQLLVTHMRERRWGVNDDTKVDFIQGFEKFVCEKSIELHNSKKDGHLLPSMVTTASKQHMGCPPPQPSTASHDSMPPKQKEDLMDWIDNYWYSLTLANALNEMIERKEADSSIVHERALEIKDEL